MERGGVGVGVGFILDTSAFSIATNSMGSSSTNHRVPHDEMDFFSREKNMKKKPYLEESSSEVKISSLSQLNEQHDHLSPVNIGLHLLTASVGSDPSTTDDGSSSNEENSKTELMQAELGKLKEENQRLKSMLSQVTGNYNSLNLQFIKFMQQKDERNIMGSPLRQEVIDEKMDVIKKQEITPRQFMDLGLASAIADTDDASSLNRGSRERSISPNNFEGQTMDNIGLNKCNFRKDLISSFDHAKSQIAREESPVEQSPQAWMPTKSPKLSNSNNSSEQAQEATMRKARVSVRARSEAPMITDGCQWRKYGQKMAKGNPCPRAYYRCTMAAGCPVRKQVQRCAEDRTILITTYEGNHNHPLPPAAMAMASTTSAAATMLLSGSMSTTDSIINPNFLAKTMLPNNSSAGTLATISASAPFPTVTLDLTQTTTTNNINNPFQRPNNSQFQIFGQNLGNQSKFSGLDTVSAATAAITADPNFTAALAAAITSIIGNGSGDHNGNNNS